MCFDCGYSWTWVLGCVGDGGDEVFLGDFSAALLASLTAGKRCCWLSLRAVWVTLSASEAAAAALEMKASMRGWGCLKRHSF